MRVNWWIPVACVAWLCAFADLNARPASAQGRSSGAPGVFDYYVLSLSWSPTFCEGARQGGSAECGQRPYAFVVHGLWPQYEHGFPRACEQPPPRLPRRIVDGMLDVMPAPALVYHEWDEHGTCSGLSPDAYFDEVRKARAAVQIPAEFTSIQQSIEISPAAVRQDFLQANPGLGEDGIAVECDNRLREVRICLSKDLRFRACPEVAGQSCRRPTVTVPPLRGAPSP